MSRKRKTHSVEFKAKCVLELLEGEKTLSEVASKYDILPKSLQQWKKQFFSKRVIANATASLHKWECLFGIR